MTLLHLSDPNSADAMQARNSSLLDLTIDIGIIAIGTVASLTLPTLIDFLISAP